MHKLAIASGALRALAASPHLRGAAAFASVAAVGSVAYVRSYPKQLPPKDPSKARLPRPVMEAMCGAIGEVLQVGVFFPIEAVKVRCQAEGLTAGVVLQRLLAHGHASALTQLYRGFGTAAVLSCLVGAVHYASFCMSKRMASEPAPPPGGAAAAADAAAAAPSGGAHANLAAAFVGALATALVESPAEMLRHQQQAGLSLDMGALTRSRGPLAALAALYGAGFVPFLMESLPFDVCELGVYGALSDYREAATARPHTPLARCVAGAPAAYWDVMSGAGAGFVAVLVSMPFDTIKTRMQLMGVEGAAMGLGAQAREFARVGAQLVAKQGPGGLFVGMAPRLASQVPSTTLCWWAIQRCRDVLEPYTRP